MTGEDMRGLTPLIYNHVNPYGRFELDMTKRLPLADVTHTTQFVLRLVTATVTLPLLEEYSVQEEC